MKRVYFLVLPQMHVLDLAGPLQIVATLGELGLADVATQCIAPASRLRSFQGAWLDGLAPLPRALVKGDALFVTGVKLGEAAPASAPWLAAVRWLREVARAAPPEVPICGVCTGSFLLGRAGLLDGRLCTTHHGFARRLQEEFPLAHVVENRVLVQDGRITTSAGVASGIDLALHLVAQQHGEHVAVHIARENVVHFRRFGNDPQLGAALRHRAHGNQRIHAVQDALIEHLATGVKVEELAARSGLSQRHLSRLFLAETGIGIKQYQLELRMDLARRLVTETTLPLERIVERCGFGSVQALRAHWNQRESLAPSALRRQAAKARRAAGGA